MMPMDGWTEVGSQKTTCCSAENFLKAVSILIEKPHVINRNLCGATVLAEAETSRCSKSVMEIFESLVTWRTQNDARWNGSQFTTCFVDRLVHELLEERLCASGTDDGIEWKVTIRQVLPKNPQKFRKLLELVLSCENNGTVMFLPLMTMCDDRSVVSEDQAFCILHHINEEEPSMERAATLTLYAEKSKSHPHHSENWLSNILLPKLVKWSEEDDLHIGAASLRLVPLERYNQVYQEMKEKYGKKLVEIWPERTDPLKFVYEEVAIASYLLVLLEEERQVKNLKHRQSFVDLGCGNGLLVYVLANEGHPGKGIDVRKRGIWDMYGPEVILEECSITPSDDSLFKDSDWLIGNHSDELTPWIPVMAARSGYNCSYFVLPCCAHDFNGKFSERRGGRSQYQSYLDYVKEVGVKCGFKVEQDMLRIPSTKRTCFIGCERTYAEAEEKDVDQGRTVFINERCARNRQVPAKQKCTGGGDVSCGVSDQSEIDSNSNCDSTGDMTSSDFSGPNVSEPTVTLLSGNDSKNCDGIGRNIDRKRRCSGASDRDDSGGKPDKQKCVESSVTDDCEQNAKSNSWVQNFKPREQVEKVRNCTYVSRDLQERIVRDVFQAVLQAKDASTLLTTDETNWNRGGSIPLGDVAKMFDKSCLSQLKNECGGLQTLLRNKHQIFMVVGGKVHLRYEDGSVPARKEKKGVKKVTSTKTKLCWFFDNHPDGCPKETKDCLFAHGQEDLKISDKH